MAHFKYLEEMNGLLKIDGPLTKGPVPRWQRKGAENTSKSSSTNSSKSKSLSSSTNSKTPTKSCNGSDVVVFLKKTPSKTPKKSPGRAVTPKTPNVGDRFIPSRSATNFEMGHFKLTLPDIGTNSSPAQAEKQRVMSENLLGTDLTNQRILAYQNKAPPAHEGFQNPMRVLYSQTKSAPASTKSSSRYIPQAPDRILDAPDIIDDYYLNLVDWSPNNTLAIALGTHVYLWNAGTGKVDQLLELEGNDYVCSVSWIQDGDHLGVGTTNGSVELWDCSRAKRLRVMDGHSARVGALAWNSYILTSGARSGQMIHHDVRQRDHKVLTLSGHTQEVCGLKWSTDGKYLASGANDNVLNIWQAASGGAHSQPQPIHTFTNHNAAVKALAWCPWQPHLLASGGGTADRHIRFWNCNTGVCVGQMDTQSQVCSLLWSTAYKELVSAHGYANNQLIIWKYPSMRKVTELTGHTARVLHLSLSPDGSTVISVGADETLRLWKCFVKGAPKSKDDGPAKAKKSVFKQSIR